MIQETEKTTGKDTGKNPHTLRKLMSKWLMALFLILVGLPFLAELLELILRLPQRLVAPWLMFAYSAYMVRWTILFLLKRKRFIEQRKGLS